MTGSQEVLRDLVRDFERFFHHRIIEGTAYRTILHYGERSRSRGTSPAGLDNAPSNLFPQTALPVPGFREKDSLENELHRRACKGRLKLKAAQHAIRTDWIAALHRYLPT